MSRIFVILCGFLGFLAVAMGAFGAHGLRTRFASLEDGARRIEWWNTAAHYHLVHALALAVVAWLLHRGAGGTAAVAGWSFVLGVVLFSGSLYALALTGHTKLGAITPFGGVLFLVGWAAVAIAGWKLGANGP